MPDPVAFPAGVARGEIDAGQSPIIESIDETIVKDETREFRFQPLRMPETFRSPGVLRIA